MSKIHSGKLTDLGFHEYLKKNNTILDGNIKKRNNLLQGKTCPAINFVYSACPHSVTGELVDIDLGLVARQIP